MSDPSQDLVISLTEVGADDLPTVGGKGANLGVLAAAGLPVPSGFCVTTAAFDRFMGQDAEIEAMLGALDELSAEDVEGVRQRAGRLREHLRTLEVPEAVAKAVRAAVVEAGQEHAYAVRSSATLEDLPDASFAGQQDTYLEIRGAADIEQRVRDCWASLFTDRAVLYRRQHGYRSSAARLAVVVQRMARPEVSGILFTADPVSGHRGICSIDASYGLGEALVSGLVDADLYRVNKATGALVEVRVGAKARAIRPRDEGGTHMVDVPESDRERRCLDDEAVASLTELGRRVEALQGGPQDIEWGIEDGEVTLLQARAITSLFPLPEPVAPGRPRVYVSFGHIQVNTVPMVPMAHSVFGHVFPFFKPGPGQVSRMLASAGGRIYMDLTAPLLRWPMSKVIPRVLMTLDSPIAERLIAAIDRPEFHKGDKGRVLPRRGVLALVRRALPRLLYRLWWARPMRSHEEYRQIIESNAEQCRQRLAAAEPGGPRLRESIRLLSELFLGPLLKTHFSMLMAGMMAWGLLRKVMRGRVSEATVRALSRGLPGNITTDMDLELGDLADRAREIPTLAEHLKEASPESAIESARALPEAAPFLERWDRFIDRYGHRGPGEIDISVPRWADDPASLVTSLVGMLGSEPGDHRRRHAAAVAEGEAAVEEILAASRGGLGLRYRLVRRLVAAARAYLALREHGKFLAMQTLMRVRVAVVEAAGLAVQRGWLGHEDDAWMLTLDELVALFEGGDPAAMRGQIEQRRDDYARYARLVPPRVMTSDGEQPAPREVVELAPGELGGLAASAGTVEGVARVVLDPREQVLHAGEILVAPFTDPGWTPLFVHASGLVMEVGGLMTHGSVVAREYGLPAVVGVDGATTRIRTGQRIRVDGDRGRVTLLDDEEVGA